MWKHYSQQWKQWLRGALAYNTSKLFGSHGDSLYNWVLPGSGEMIVIWRLLRLPSGRQGYLPDNRPNAAQIRPEMDRTRDFL